MTLRGKSAIVGIGELPTQREYPGRSAIGLAVEAARLAIEDAGLKKSDIDGIVTSTTSSGMAEQLGIRPSYATMVNMEGATGAAALLTAASAIASGLADNVLITLSQARDTSPAIPPDSSLRAGKVAIGSGGFAASTLGEFEGPFGTAAGWGSGYALMYQRHMFEYGTRPEQLAKIAVDQRFNAIKNPNAVFKGAPITIDDVLNSRYVNAPLHLLECVMPAAGAHAVVLTTAERAKSAPNKPAYILGGGVGLQSNFLWQRENITSTPVQLSAPKAFRMAGYSPRDIQFAEFYDCYTILLAMTIEDAGFCPKGEVGNFYQCTDTTYKGTFPINTDGGQLSGGQTTSAYGARQIVEAARQIMGRAGERQVQKNDLCMVNGNGGTATEECTLIVGSADAL